MALFSFYNNRRPRTFNHKPIYWDSRKEALDERVFQVKKEMGMVVSDEKYKPRIKGTFVQGTTHLKKRVEQGETAQSRRYVNVKLAIVLALLLVVFWFIFLK
jgi:hypothetical protein